MPSEEKLESIQKEIERKIKIALIGRNMTQAELADLIGESRFSVNQAIKGNSAKGAVRVRKKIYRFLGMEWDLYMKGEEEQWIKIG